MVRVLLLRSITAQAVDQWRRAPRWFRTTTHRSRRLLALAISTAVFGAVPAAFAVTEAAALASGTARTCASERAALDAAIDRAGASDPRWQRAAQSRWLRLDRFTAGELARGEFVTAALELAAAHDASALAREHARLSPEESAGLPAPSDLVICRAQALRALAADDAALRALTEAGPPREYLEPRGLGTYPFARPFLRAGSARWRAAERARADAPAPAIARVYHAPTQPLAATETAATIARARADHRAGWPVLSKEALSALAAGLAPEIATASLARSDRAGRLVGQAGRAHVRPGEPVLNVDHTLTRWGRHVLLQLSFTVWFDERPAAHALDPYAGAVDGVVFRVTLGDDGRALLWESIHACGCFYTVVLPSDRALTLRTFDEHELEPPLLLRGPPAGARPRFVLAAGTHLLGHVLPSSAPCEEPSVARAPYVLEPYAALLAAGPQAPPFDRWGVLQGTQRLERFFLWPSGIRAPGAMRSNGRHATAFLGERHFERHELLGGRLQPKSP